MEQGDQRSIEWIMSRVAHVTCSRFADVMDKLKNGNPGAKRTKYMLDVVAERISGTPTEHYVTAAMERGVMMEPMARAAYEAKTGCIVDECGFIHHPTLQWVGGSLDGFVDDQGIIEIKAPTTSTHLTTILSGECLHLPQIMGYLWLTGRQWCDFISYDDRMPEPLNLYIQRIPRNDAYIAALEAEVRVFLGEVDALVKRLTMACRVDTQTGELFDDAVDGIAAMQDDLP